MPIKINPIAILCCLILICGMSWSGAARADAALVISSEGRIDSVVVHRGWASVVRRVEIHMDASQIELQIDNLPTAVLADSVQAEIEGDAATVVVVRQIQVRKSTEGVLSAHIVLNVESENDDAAAIMESTITVNLQYVVRNADWMPAYSLRALTELGVASLEYDVIVGQNTGEDWNDVVLQVSSMQGNMAIWESTLQQSPADVTRNKPRSSRNNTADQDDSLDESNPWASLFDAVVGNGQLFAQHANSPSWENSPTIARSIKGRISVESGTMLQHASPPNSPADVETGFGLGETLGMNFEGGGMSSNHSNSPVPRAFPVRFRVDTMRSRSNFQFVGIPRLSQNALLVGSVRNIHTHHLLPGPVSVFKDGVLTGEIILPDFAPGDVLNIAYGLEEELLVHRRETSRDFRKTGLLSDGREHQLRYLLSVVNHTGKAVSLQLWDQIPITSNDDITIAVRDLSIPQSTDGTSTKDLLERGLLRWELTVPAGQSSSGAQRMVEYMLSISHHKDAAPRWIP